MARKIQIRWATSPYVVGRDDGIRVRIEVSCAEGMTSKIFAYRMLSKNPNTGTQRGYFSHICSPVDIDDYPEDAPIPTHVPEWFRLDFVDVLLRSETEVEAFIEDVRDDIYRLIRSLKAVDNVAPTGTDDFFTGIVCDSESSGSSLSSYSSASLPSESLGPLRSIASVGSFENQAGAGEEWTNFGIGAGSPVGSSDSLAPLVRNMSRVVLPEGFASKILIVQGFDFGGLPENALIRGLLASLTLRDASGLDLSLGSLPGPQIGSESSSSSSAGLEIGPRLYFFRILDPDQGYVGDFMGQNQVILGPEWQNMVFGSQNDMLGTQVSAKTLRERGDFGFGLVIGVPMEQIDRIVDVDGIRLTVFYQ